MSIYTPAGGPRPMWRPRIVHVPRHLHPGRSYRLHGKQLNGLSQACAYGDDQQMATNYPLVRLWSHAGAFYCRTWDHSTMGVATGDTIHHTHFHVPHHVPHGDYRLVVIANGIASHPIGVCVERRRHRDHDGDEHHNEHDEEMEVFEHEETKYKDKDAKEAKEKEKDIKDTKEKDTKEFKDKDCKDVEHKYCKEVEHKTWKEKEHKEFEGKGCKEKEYKEHKEKDCPENTPPCPPREDARDRDELLHRIDRLVERIEQVEQRFAGRPFIGHGERPEPGEHVMRRGTTNRTEFEHEPSHRAGEHDRHDNGDERGGDRAAEERRLAEEEHRRSEVERKGAAPRRGAAQQGAERKAPRPRAPKR